VPVEPPRPSATWEQIAASSSPESPRLNTPQFLEIAIRSKSDGRQLHVGRMPPRLIPDVPLHADVARQRNKLLSNRIARRIGTCATNCCEEWHSGCGLSLKTTPEECRPHRPYGFLTSPPSESSGNGHHLRYISERTAAFRIVSWSVLCNGLGLIQLIERTWFCLITRVRFRAATTRLISSSGTMRFSSNRQSLSARLHGGQST